MSAFMEEEAEVGSTSESDIDSDEGDLLDEEPRRKKKQPKKKKRHMVDSDDSEEEDGEDLDRDLPDLINDEDVDEGEEESDVEGEEGVDRKRGHSDEEDEDLSDEDYDLIEENLGHKIKRKGKRKRIRFLSGDDESGKDEDEGDDREAIARQIFEGDEGDDVEHQEAPPAHADRGDFGNLDESDVESDEDDFIVDDEGQPVSKGKKKKHIIHDDAALQEAQDIFGVDFDYEEFEEYGEDYEEDEDDEMAEDEEEDIEEREARRQRKAAKRRAKKSTIFEVFEPSELERSHFTDLDQEIRAADMPERFRLRGIPICPSEEKELKGEAEWIYKNAFVQAPLSRQEYFESEVEFRSSAGGRTSRKGPSTTGKIHDALNFMRNQQFEVPFIAFYRKEYVDPDLNINDLWKVYQWDEKWMQLRNRKQNLVRLIERMQQYQFEIIDPEADLDSHIRALTDEDIERARNVQSMEELKDVYQHFLLYYGSDIPKMKQALKSKKSSRSRRPAGGGEGGEGEEDAEDKAEEDEVNEDHDAPKQASRKSGYTMCVQAGLAELARKFGLTPEQFGVNVRDNYERHEVEQDPEEPKELAEQFIKGQFSSVDEVLRGARHMVAMQIAHDPLVRQCVRQTFNERAKISLQATKKGAKEIDEGHPCYTFKYLKNKPVLELSEDQFLKIQLACDDGLLTYEIHIDEKDNTRIQSYFDEIKQLYTRDEFSHLVQEWNEQRALAVERALTLILYPNMVSEIKAKLLSEAKESIIKSCCRKLYNWLKVAPYQVDQPLEDDDDEEYDASHGVRVMGMAYSTDRNEASFCAVIDGQGEVTDFMRMTQTLTRRDSWRQDDRDKKAKELEQIKKFILSKKPHVIALSAESRDALQIMDDLRGVLVDLEQEHQIVPINIELIDNEPAKLYSSSKKGQQDFREYPELLRQAVSVARRLQDPLIEFAQLCNPDEDILSFRYHTLQNHVPKEDLLGALYLEFVNRVNEVGVDVNRCVAHPHTASLVQFVCGLGPRKGYYLLKTLKQNNSRLENRTQLVTMTHARMGPKVFINCAGFIKIDTNALGDSTEAYVEVLDGSRVHPETYEWARKMAVDALEYDDTAEDANPAGALEEILESPERLKDLDLDAFAEELERQGYGDKHITLYDIRAELNHRYKDLRAPYRSPTSEERFNMLTKETPQTFFIGKLVMCAVTGIAHRRPGGEQLDNANPVRDDDTGLWQCPFCKKNDFPELSEVWNHFDAQECRGQAVGVRTRLDNSISGFIPLKFLSDKHVTNPEDRVKTGMTLHCRITKIDIDRFQVELTSRTSDLTDKDSKWKLQKDPCYDFSREEQDVKKEESKQKHQASQKYVKRVIVHPAFHNIDYRQCEKLMASMEQGDVIVRPSSKGSDRLTVTWKVADCILHHIDVREEGKENAFSLGTSLIIDSEKFEDLDEIIARYIQPMAAFARDILNYKYYKDSEGGSREIMDKICSEEKRKAPSKIPYYFSASKQYPGKFLLSYTPRKSTMFEFVTVTPEGLRYRSQIFPSLNGLIRWFKEHFRDPIPGTPVMKTPLGMTSNSNQSSTPKMSNVELSAIQRAASGLPSSVFNTLSQVAGQTPFGNVQPLSTPLMTPMMTPAQQALMTPQQQPGLATPVQQHMSTPQYQPTPRSSGSNSRKQPTQAQTNNMADWAKMAQIWAKNQQQTHGQKSRSRRGGSGTPRPEASPMVTDTPGGETPLFDER